jgi:hypothetical protein
MRNRINTVYPPVMSVVKPSAHTVSFMASLYSTAKAMRWSNASASYSSISGLGWLSWSLNMARVISNPNGINDAGCHLILPRSRIDKIITSHSLYRNSCSYRNKMFLSTYDSCRYMNCGYIKIPIENSL